METDITPSEARLINTIKMDFAVTDDWKTAEHIFTAIEFYHFMAGRVSMPCSFESFIELLESIPLEPVLNENNHKYYYLLNSQ